MSDGLESIEPAALIDRLDRALDDSGGATRCALAADGDGTLWTGDVGEALFEALLDDGERWLRQEAHAALRDELVRHAPDVAVPATPAAIARALWTLYLAGRYPEDRMFATTTWCMAGCTVRELDAFCGALLDGAFGLRNRLIRESGAVLEWAARRSVPTFLVSASPRTVVERAARVLAEVHAIAPPTVLAMTPALEEEVILPALTGVWTYGEGKAVALTAALAGERRTLVAAMGDSAFDASMLRAVKVPIAIRPKPALVAIAASIPGLMRAATIP